MAFRNKATIFLMFLLGFFLLCKIPVDPDTNPDNAKIKKSNLLFLSDTIPVGTVYPCTVVVSLRNLINSVVINVANENTLTTVFSGVPKSDTIKTVLEFLKPANYIVSIHVFKEGGVDSLVKKVSVFSTTPVAKFVSSRKMVAVGDSMACTFRLNDPDSNLTSFITRRDGLMISKTDVLYSERFLYNGSVIQKAVTDLRKMNVFSVVAIDADSQYSLTATCTLFVKDSIVPEIKLLKPSTDSVFAVATLPCTLAFRVHDNWVIDSIKISGYHQNTPSNDTCVLIESSLDSGTTRDSVEVWDRGGNRSVLRYKITYNGLKQYAPKLKSVIIPPVFEHGRFDTLYLDSIVVITDTSAKYTMDALTWNITADSTDPFLVARYDSLKRTFYIEVVDKEIFHDRYSSYSIKVTDPKGLSSETLHLTYFLLEKNDLPVIDIRDQVKLFGKAFDTLVLAKCGTDPDPSDRISWTIQAGKFFKPDSIWSTRTILPKSQISPFRPVFTGRVAIIPDTTRIDMSKAADIIDSLKFTASDGMLSSSKYVKFKWSKPIIPIPIQ